MSLDVAVGVLVGEAVPPDLAEAAPRPRRLSLRAMAERNPILTIGHSNHALRGSSRCCRALR